jgi:hypothetical protein
MSDCCKGDFSDGMIRHSAECWTNNHKPSTKKELEHELLAARRKSEDLTVAWHDEQEAHAKTLAQVKELEAVRDALHEKAVRLGTALTMPCGQPNFEDSACQCCQRRWLRADPQGIYR